MVMFLNCSRKVFHKSITDRTNECSNKAVLQGYITTSFLFLKLNCTGRASNVGNRDLK